MAQAAAKVVLEPIFETQFRDSSYRFGPKRSAHQAMEQLRQAVNRGANWIVELDIEAFLPPRHLAWVASTPWAAQNEIRADAGQHKRRC